MYGYETTKDGTFSLFAYPPEAPFCMHQGATPDGKLIVGYYREKGASVNRGYLLSEDGTVTTFVVPGASSTSPMDINQAGLIVGMYRNPGETSAYYHGFVIDTKRSIDKSRWTYVYPVDFPTAGVTKTIFRGVNASGDIVGDYLGTDGKTHGLLARPNRP